MNDIEQRRARSGMELVVRILATGAVWTVVSVIGFRLPHPTIRLTLGAVALVLTVLIWTHNSKSR